MIESCKHKGLQKLYEKGVRSGLRTDIAMKGELYLSILDTASSLKELDMTGCSFHPLRGNLRGFYSVVVSRNHRIIFRFDEGNACDVD